MRALPGRRGAMLGRERPKTELAVALGHCRSAFIMVGLFSAVINLLMLTSPIYMLQVYDRVLTTGRVETLVALTVMCGAALLILSVLDTLRTSVTVRIGSWLTNQVGPILMASSINAKLKGESQTAQPLRDLSTVQSFIATNGLTAIFDLPWVPLFLILLWMLHPVLGMTGLVSALVLLGFSLLNELAIRKPTTNANLANIKATNQADVAIRNAEVVRAMGMLPALIERWKRTNDLAVMALQKAGERSGFVVSISKFVRQFVQIAILGLGAWLVLKGEVTGGAMIASSIILSRALAPVEAAISVWRNFTNTRIAYARLQSQLEAYPIEPPRMRLPMPVGNLSVENLTFASPDSGAIILRQVSFAVQPGEVVAVVGPSAAGKSTLCRFLVGTQTPNSGKVRLDGSEIGHWNVEQLGKYVGYLPQDVELFAGTVHENICRMGIGNDEDVVEAARLAHAHEMIQRLPNGYATPIGDGGARLSGGQRQRIGLARAVYGDPKLIVLDEPNANLDQAGEAALAAALGDLKQRGAAIVVVGHRPSTLAQADKILLLKEGRVEIFGPRDEVLQKLREASAAAGGASAPQRKPVQAPQQGQDAAAGAQRAAGSGKG